MLGDALTGCLIVMNGFSREDLSRLHSSGALGRRLLFRFKDIMRSGEELPLVQSSTLMRQALIKLTHKAIGAVLVVSDSRRLEGIFNDGDLRRAVQEHENLLNLEVDRLMTKKPVAIHEDRMAAEALSLMETVLLKVRPSRSWIPLRE